MPRVNHTVATLRFYGDDLRPDELTRLLGSEPTETAIKGDSWVSPSGRTRVAKSGSWRLEVEDREPGDLDWQVENLLNRLTGDLEVWWDLTTRFKGDLFCGLFMKEGNEGISLAPQTLAMLGLRNLTLDFDIYGELRDDN